MITIARHFLAVVAGTLACYGTTRYTGDESAPDDVLARAIERAGGRAALERAKALVWDGDAVVHAGGRTINITGHWAVQPPDTAIVATYDVTRGPSTMRSMIIAAPRGWTEAAGQFTPLSAAVLANERDEFFLYDVLRLVRLRSRGVTLAPAPSDSLGQLGVRASQPGRPDVTIYVDADGRLAHVSFFVADPGGGAAVRQDAWLEGTLEDGGIRWPRTLRLTMAGQPYFDLTMRALKVLPRLRDTLLAGPRAR